MNVNRLGEVALGIGPVLSDHAKGVGLCPRWGKHRCYGKVPIRGAVEDGDYAGREVREMSMQSDIVTPKDGRSRWHEPLLLTKLGKSTTEQVFMWVGVLGAASLDALMMKPIFAQVLDDPNPFFMYVMAFGVVFLATGVAHISGRALRARTRSAVIFSTVLMVGWAAFGAMVTWMRYIAEAEGEVVQGPAVQGADAPAVVPAADGLDQGALLVALVLVFLYVLTGMVKFYLAYSARNDAHAAVTVTRARVDDLGPRLAEVEAAYAKAQAAAAALDQRIGWGVDELADEETRASEALRDLSLATARVEFARHLGDPAITGTASRRHPDHPLRDQQTDGAQAERTLATGPRG